MLFTLWYVEFGIDVLLSTKTDHKNELPIGVHVHVYKNCNGIHSFAILMY